MCADADQHISSIVHGFQLTPRPAERICRALVSMPEFEASNSISCFLSMNDEVDTSSIVNEILLQGACSDDASRLNGQLSGRSFLYFFFPPR